ncbi:MAG: hypothetical protein MUP11_06650 [Anaerolineales bacterium]|nr:hypothetical protein [Anaerolineales bacterium]
MTINDENTNDELEQKITAAEIEAQIEEPKTGQEVPSSFETAVKENPEEAAPKKEKPSKARMIWRSILVWLVIVAISFAGGFFMDAAVRYQPQKALVQVLNEDLAAAGDEITGLESEVERLSLFEDQNITLAEEINQQKIHLTVLSARAAVADATLAVEQDRSADAKLALDKLGTTLGDLKSMLNADQAEVVENMIQRHTLILIEWENDSFSVQTDLEILASKLNTLENTLFAAP